MNKILKFFNDNHSAAIAAATCLVLVYWLFGCQSKVSSITNPTQKITRAELQIEIDHLLAIAQSKMQDLDRQDEVRRLILEKASLFAADGEVNPLGIINLLVSIGAIGTAVDSRRKLKDAKKT